jgi:polyhydroxybutyrate depolymerase
VKHDRCAPAPRRVVDDGGHSRPGAESVRRGKEGASKALNYNDVIWGFFKASAAR